MSSDPRAVAQPLHEPRPAPRRQPLAQSWPTWLWALLLIALATWVAVRLGALDLYRTVRLPDGTTARLVDTFATVDHPFHVARAETLRRQLADWSPLRWVANHQGGYPVEFYPLGEAWLEVGAWAAFLGRLPLAAIHKLVIIAIFLLPGLAYALMARRDRWGLGVAWAALALHVAVPGGTPYTAYEGGYSELVLWGLVTNVAAAVALLFTLFWLTCYLERGARARGALAGAVLAATFAIDTNPRSLIALGVIGVGTALAIWRPHDPAAPGWRPLLVRLLTVGALTALLTAPVLLPLARFSHLYYFVRYAWYDNLGQYLQASARAISWPGLLFAAGGTLAALRLPARPVTRAAAVTLLLYVAVTVVLSAGGKNGTIIEQLETPRLMPFQRLLMIYLAAVGLAILAEALLPRLPAAREALVLTAAGALLLVYLVPLGPVAEADRGLAPVTTTATPQQAELATAVTAANAAARPGTALLIVGSALSWHEPLWAPLWTDRTLFYDNWLWNWSTWHWAPGYDYRIGNAYAAPKTALDPAYFARHGIGAVLVTGARAQSDAAALPDLQPLRQGTYAVYLVRDPAPIVTFAAGSTATVTVTNGAIQASGTSGGGVATIRRTWFPRWRASVNGTSAPITRTADGYMTVPVPEGSVMLKLTYIVDGWDWLARALAVAGAVALAALVLRRPTAVVRYGPHRPKAYHRISARATTPSATAGSNAPVACSKNCG